MNQKIKQGKLSVSEYVNAWKNGAQQIADQQARIARAFSTPMGNGIHAVTIPAAATIDQSVSAAERLNRTLKAQGEILTGLGTKVQDWGKNTQWAGRQLTVGLTMPFAMAATAAGKYALDIDKAMVHIEKVYDGSLKGLRESAMGTSMEITQRLGLSVKSSLDVMGELAAAGKTGSEMMALTTEAQRLSALGSIDQSEAIKGVISMQAIYKMSTEDVAKAVNYLNSVEAATPTNLQDLVDSIPIAGAMVAQLGGTLEDTTVLLTAFKERGISTVEGANAIKTAMNRIISPTAGAVKTFKELTGQNLEDIISKTGGKPLETMQAIADVVMNGNIALVDQQRIIKDLVGIYQSSRITGLMQGLAQDDGAVSKAKELSAKTDQELAAIAQKHEKALTSSASGQFTIAVESFKAQLQEFGKFALGLATAVINGFKGVLEFFNGLPAPLKTAALIIGGLAALAGPILMLVGIVGNLIGSVMKAGGFMLTLGKKYKTMTLDEKAAELQSRALNGQMLTQTQTTQLLIYQLEKLSAAYTGMNAAAAQSMIAKGSYGNFEMLTKQRDQAEKAEKQAAQRLAELEAQKEKLLRDPSKVTQSSSFAGGMIFRTPSGREEYNKLNAEIDAQKNNLTAAINERKNAVTAAIKAETSAMSAVLKEQAMAVRSQMLANNRDSAAIVAAGGMSFNRGEDGTWREYDQSTGKVGANASVAHTEALNQGWNSVAIASGQAADNIEKSSRFQKVFNQNTMLGVSAVAGVAGMAAEAGSGFEKWMNTISLVTLGLTALGPVLSSIGNKVKNLSVVQNITGAVSGGGGMAGKLKGAFSGITGMVSKMFGPVGLGIAAAIGGVTALFSIITNKQQEQREHQRNLNQSTDVWTNLLGKTKLQWGQIKTEAGEVKDTVDSLAATLKASEDPKVQALIKEFSNQKGAGLADAALNEVFRMQGQGFNAKEIEQSLRAAMKAAGKSLAEQDEVIIAIKGKIDFSNAKGDLDTFAAETAGDFKNIFNAALNDRQGFTPSKTGGDYGPSWEFAPNFMDDINQTAQTVIDRFTNLEGVDRKLAVETLAQKVREITGEAFGALKSKYGDVITGDYMQSVNSLLKYDDKNKRYYADTKEMRDQGKGDRYIEAAQGLSRITNAELDFARAIGRATGAGQEQIDKINNINDVLPMLTTGTFSAAQVQDAYNKALKAAADSGQALTDEEKQQLAQRYASIFGLDAAKLATNQYAASQENAAKKIQDNARALQDFIPALKAAADASKDFWEDTAVPGDLNTEGAGFQGPAAAVLGNTPGAQGQALTERIKGIYSGTMDDVYQAYADSAQEIWERRLDNITKSFERRREALQQEIENFDKAYEAKQQAFNDRWDETMELTKKSFDDRQKAIENEADAQIEAIDAQIEALQSQKEAEEELEEQRQKAFEREKRRIERMAELANRNIDYNRALYGGDLDEAARVQNNTESLTIGWSIDDANERAEDRAAEKSKMTDKQIEELEGTKELVQKQKEAKLEALREEEEAVTKSLEKQREAERRSMEQAREIERQRLQNRLDSLQKEQQAAEEKERKVQEFQRRTMETELATLKAFIPQNEQQLNDHINRVGGAYGEFGLGLQGAGSMWGQIVGNALQNNVDKARMQMSSDANWSAFGAQVAGAISQGAFGLNLTDFMNLLKTGNPPAGWTPPGATPYSGNGIAGGRHQGGPIDGTPGSRNGRGNSPIGSDEQVIVAQKGEFMINKAAVQKIGTQHLERINAGQPMSIDGGVNFAGIAGGMAAAMGRSMLGLAVNRLAEHYAAQNSAVAAALGFGGGSGTGAAVDFAKAQDGKPYIWGGVGPAGYDCSGYMSAIANVLTGQNPHKRLFSTGMVQNGKAFGPFIPGLGGKFQIGVSNGHTAGTLLGTNVESTGNHVRYGKDAKGATDKQFHLRFHVPDSKVVEGAANWSAGGGDPGGSGTERWRPTVVQALGIMGLTQSWANSTLRRMHQESGGNPSIVNNWDSNARRGTPSVGLMQVIGPTYAANKHPGYDVGPYLYGTSINPLANILASMKYAMRRYGSLPAAYDRKGGYDWGGDVLPGDTLVQNRTNGIETIVTAKTRDEILDSLSAANVTYQGFTDILKKSALPNMSSWDTGIGSQQAGDVYYNVEINGTNLTEKELERAISNAIDKKHNMQQKKVGKIK